MYRLLRLFPKVGARSRRCSSFQIEPAALGFDFAPSGGFWLYRKKISVLTVLCTPERTHFAAPPFQTTTTSLGCDFVEETILENSLFTAFLAKLRNTPFPAQVSRFRGKLRGEACFRVQARLAPLGPRPGMPACGGGSALLGTNCCLTARLRLNPLKKWGYAFSPRNKRRWSSALLAPAADSPPGSLPVVFALRSAHRTAV